MGERTGRPRGRPLGAKNRRTAEREAAAKAAAETIGQAVDGAFEGDAHAFLMAVYKDPGKPDDVRLDAAKAAIRYEKPALAAVAHSGRLTVDPSTATDEQLAAVAFGQGDAAQVH
jgi:hypothetical protein